MFDYGLILYRFAIANGLHPLGRLRVFAPLRKALVHVWSHKFAQRRKRKGSVATQELGTDESSRGKNCG